MSALKTVERSSKLKTLEKRLDVATRNIVDCSNQINTVNRQLDSLSQKIDVAKCRREFMEFHNKGKFGGLSGAKLDKAEMLDGVRDSLMQKCDDLSEMQNILEGQLADGMDVADELESVRAEFDKIDAELNSLTTEINDMVKTEKVEFEAEIAELTAKQDELLENRDFLESKSAENVKEFNNVKEKLNSLKGGVGKKFSVNALAKRGIKGGAALGLNTVKGAVKSGFTKVDPLSGGINKGNVDDTGMESIRFARQGMNKTVKGIKTTQKTIKTTVRGIKTVKNATVATAKATYKVATAAVKAAIFMGKIAVKAVTHIIAAMMNPVFWIIAGVLLVAGIFAALVVMLMGAAGGGRSTMAATGAVGLGDVTGQYMSGVEFRNTSIDSERNAVNALIDATSYNGSNLPNSDLIFMQITRPDNTVIQYQTAFAAPWQTGMLQAMPWSFPNNQSLLDVNDTIAIAYVLLQQRANTANGTSGVIYSVTFTQAVFDEIMGLSVSYNSTIYHNQTCPNANCVPATDDDPATCDSNHDLHAIGFWYHSADTVMSALGFTAADRQWVTLTAAGFEANPNI